MLAGLRNLFSSGPAPYADPKASIPLGEVLRRNWFELWYQPKIELRTMHLVGAEALVRARHPTRGIVPPIFFLPDAGVEDMHALTERVILMALRDWENFAHYGVPLKLAVNVPVSALVDLPFPRMLRENASARGQLAGAEHWRSPRTRSSTTSISPRTLPMRCVNSKCDLSVDDFGAGYPSLVRLKPTCRSAAQDRPQLRRELQRGPFQRRSVRDNRRARPSFRPADRRGGRRNQTHESHKLQSIGCEVGQGYLFAKPMPQAQLVGHLRSRMTGPAAAHAVNGRLATI